ncbi:MAG: hypothetical protein IKJ42_10760 [Bacteroidaceae bacterium]|nr:hypothetical protein [Bacteroidaceae bacterium]
MKKYRLYIRLILLMAVACLQAVAAMSGESPFMPCRQRNNNHSNRPIRHKTASRDTV